MKLPKNYLGFLLSKFQNFPFTKTENSRKGQYSVYNAQHMYSQIFYDAEFSKSNNKLFTALNP